MQYILQYIKYLIIKSYNAQAIINQIDNNIG